MPTLDLGFPYDAIPSRRQLIDNNSTEIVHISNFKFYPSLSPDVHNIAPQAYYTAYVSGSTGGVSPSTKETIYSLPIVFNVDLFVGESEDNVVPLRGVRGPRGVRTLSNDIQYYHFHKELGTTASTQATSGIPTAGEEQDSQSGLNSLYKITSVEPFALPIGHQLYMDVSSTQADLNTLSSVVSSFVLDNPTYTEDIQVYYHAGQKTNGAAQFLEFYNSSIGSTSFDLKTLDEAFLAITFDYYGSRPTDVAGFSRINLTGSSYIPSSGEVTTSSGDFITLLQNKDFPKIMMVEDFPYISGKGNLTITKLRVYAAEYNKSGKAVYDFYKLRSNGVYDPIATRVPVSASANEFVGNTMVSILSGTSALDLQEEFFDSRGHETIKLSHRTNNFSNDGESIVAICREDSLEGTGIQVLALQYEGFYEQDCGYLITSQTGRKYSYDSSAGRWDQI
tara:strand:- start:63 stop:1412 length:1350 start_codon:yes stop_codon:yes gene_type:complete